MADWDEIKKLAADFHRVQLTSTAHKLSERNCIEIVQKLINTGLLEVIYTTDGKEYLTPQQLEREIKDELFVHGGRVNLVDLQQIINVDLSHVDNKVSEILRHDKSLVLIQGDLIDKDYLDRMAEEINETLQEAGQVFIAELSKTFSLPTDFMLEVVESRLDIQIMGKLDQMDRNVLYTHAFIARQTARMRGVLSAITRPTQFSNIISKYGFQEKLFYSVIGDLLSSKRIMGSTQGRQDKISFVPDVYTQAQNNWVDDFFKQNGYVEYDALTRLGITDGKQFLKRRYHGNEIFLPTCCVGERVLDQADAAIDDALSSGTWVDIMPHLPTPFTPDDAEQLLQHCLKTPGRSTAHVYCSSIVASDKFVEACKAPFETRMHAKAKKDAAESPALFAELSKKDLASLKGGGGGADRREARKEDRRKTASSGGKGGGSVGGRGGRETKTKKVKKKDFRNRNDEDDTNEADSRSNPDELQFMTTEEIAEVLRKDRPDIDDDFLEELAQEMHRPLTRAYQQVARAVLQSSGDKKRKSHAEIQEKVNALWSNAKLFDKSINLFPEDVQVHLSRHLLRTVCTDITNLMVNMLAADHMLAVTDETTITPETRLKIIKKMPEEIKAPLTKLNSSLTAKETEEFFAQFDLVAGQGLCELMIKKLDKKKERQISIERRAALQEQLRHEDEPAMTLHLAVSLLFQHFTSSLLHAPGRCVPQIIALLAEHVTPEQHEILLRCQSLVVKQLTRSGSDEVEEEAGDEHENEAGVEKSTAVLLEEGMREIKKMVLELKKDNSKNES
ncbi:E3 UFM1-protein ligase 1 homolog [Nematostella vectensis]|uniref:E3 UFM1-protein ligase 1 homolog n=1 Tax=Nematostella vectensis TaxID=45351 RepID=UPI0020778763|nr:E3 UFM1-protein ligase 1 homolog [Nematostella vectensis]